MDAPRPQRNRIHVGSRRADDEAEARVAAAIAAGGRVVNDANAPGWWTFADPEGNEVDVASSPTASHPERSLSAEIHAAHVATGLAKCPSSLRSTTSIARGRLLRIPMTSETIGSFGWSACHVRASSSVRVTARGPDALDAMIRMLVRSRAGGADRASSRPRPEVRAGQVPDRGSRPGRPRKYPWPSSTPDSRRTGAVRPTRCPRPGPSLRRSARSRPWPRRGIAARDPFDPLGDGDIQLDRVRPQAEHMAEVREAGPDVVDRELDTSPPERFECGPELLVVHDGSVLGDLQHDLSTCDGSEQLTQSR